eukprot:scaffold1726_cov260-Pinguiococcus_pyrenoidosus.AAC.28
MNSSPQSAKTLPASKSAPAESLRASAEVRQRPPRGFGAKPSAPCAAARAQSPRKNLEVLANFADSATIALNMDLRDYQAPLVQPQHSNCLSRRAPRLSTQSLLHQGPLENGATSARSKMFFCQCAPSVTERSNGKKSQSPDRNPGPGAFQPFKPADHIGRASNCADFWLFGRMGGLVTVWCTWRVHIDALWQLLHRLDPRISGIMLRILVVLALCHAALALDCTTECSKVVDAIYDDTVQNWCNYLKRYRSRRTVMEVCRDSSKAFLEELCEATCSGEDTAELMEKSRGAQLRVKARKTVVRLTRSNHPRRLPRLSKDRQIEACRQYLQTAPMPIVHNICVKVYTDGYAKIRTNGVGAIIANVPSAKASEAVR